jgi:hypothetical protein
MNALLKYLLLLPLALLFSLQAWSRDGSQRYSHVNKPLILDLRFSNDFPFGIDRYFSNGLEAGIFWESNGRKPLDFMFLPHGNGSKLWYSIGVRHHIFTPVNIYTSELMTHDRPYAAYLLIRIGRDSYNQNGSLKIGSRLDVGMMGPAAGGGAVQNFAHQNIMSWFSADGWENELNNDFLLNYSVDIQKGLFTSGWLQFVAGGRFRIGQPYTDGSVRTNLRIGMFQDYFNGPGISSGSDWQLYLYSGLEHRIVVYNAALQGGLFSRQNTHVRHDIERQVTLLETGIAFSFKGIKMEIGQFLKTREFSAGRQHNWGYARLQIQF